MKRNVPSDVLQRILPPYSVAKSAILNYTKREIALLTHSAHSTLLEKTVSNVCLYVCGEVGASGGQAHAMHTQPHLYFYRRAIIKLYINLNKNALKKRYPNGFYNYALYTLQAGKLRKINVNKVRPIQKSRLMLKLQCRTPKRRARPIVLFEQSLCEQLSHCKELYETPENAKNTKNCQIQAPIKQIKRRIMFKMNMRPKKLTFSEDSCTSSIMDSGIDVDSISQRMSGLSTGGDSLKRKYDRSNLNSESQSVNSINKAMKRNINKENDGRLLEKLKHQGQTTNKVHASSSNFNNVHSSKINKKGKLVNSWKDRLQWLQRNRDVGLYVECCNKICKKWRYVELYNDPEDVPEVWFCCMNPDKNFASCQVPEESIPPTVAADLMLTKYNSGSLVLARVKGFPWWPAMVDDSPETATYYILNKTADEAVEYHVVFFDEPQYEVTRQFVRTNQLKPFLKHQIDKAAKRVKNSRLKVAYEIARNAQKLTLLERRLRYSFLARYKGNDIVTYYDYKDEYDDINENPNIEIVEVESQDNSECEEIPTSQPTQDSSSFSLNFYPKMLKKF
ncbi:uncharacterized protein [Prorops nasuta]|uniref:uncharacterized protein n=1 Tax=Prorops nasuta TaxID=863751 RepID=UPI0034CF2A06